MIESLKKSPWSTWIPVLAFILTLGMLLYLALIFLPSTLPDFLSLPFITLFSYVGFFVYLLPIAGLVLGILSFVKTRSKLGLASAILAALCLAVMIYFIISLFFGDSGERGYPFYHPTLSVSPEGATIASTFFDNQNRITIRLTDIEGRLIREIESISSGTLASPTYSPSGELFAFVDYDSSYTQSIIYLADPNAGDILKDIIVNMTVTSLVFSADEQKVYFLASGDFGHSSPLASSSYHGWDVYAWDIGLNKVTGLSSLQEYQLKGLALDARNGRLITSEFGLFNGISYRDLSEEKVLFDEQDTRYASLTADQHMFTDFNEEDVLIGIELSGDSPSVYTLNRTYYWKSSLYENLENDKEEYDFSQGYIYYKPVDISPDGKSLAFIANEFLDDYTLYQLYILDFETGNVLQKTFGDHTLVDADFIGNDRIMILDGWIGESGNTGDYKAFIVDLENGAIEPVSNLVFE